MGNITEIEVLFITNTPPEYRIPLYQLLSSQYPVAFVFTELDLAKKIYKNDLDIDKMTSIRYIPFEDKSNKFSSLRKIIIGSEASIVVIPPLDSIKQTAYAYWIYFFAKKQGCKTIYFWGKWEAPIAEQPTKKRIKNLVQRLIARPVIKHSDYLLGYGEKACEYLINNGAKPSRCDSVFYSSMSPQCELSDWKSANNIPIERKCILYFGRIIEKKGLKYLIDAFRLLGNELKKSLWLVVVGDGPDKKMFQDYASDLGVESISWIGYVHPDKRHDYFAQCDIFVLPTFYYQGSVEAWGMTVNEALECGKILVATEAVGSAYELINQKNGRIAKPGDAASLSEALTEAVVDIDPKGAAIEDERLLTIYNYNNSARKFIEIFSSITS